MRSNDTLWSDAESPSLEPLAEGVILLRSFCREEAPVLYSSVEVVANASPFRQMVVPGGHTMSVAMTNTGTLGWTSDRDGYRYSPVDPVTNCPWPAMPEPLLTLARRTSKMAGLPDFIPNSCLINRYSIGARLSLHQDKNEQDYTHPIVSVSLGLPATFLLGTLRRSDTPRQIRIEHGDVLVWGGPARLIYHGVAPVAAGNHFLTGPFRVNLTFRRAAPTD